MGPNGSGKSTLLRVLAGRDVGREDGELWIRKGLRVAFLEQEPFDESLDVLEALYAADTPLMRLLRDYDEVMAAQATEHDPEAARDTRRGSVPSVSARLAEVLDRMDADERVGRGVAGANRAPRSSGARRSSGGRWGSPAAGSVSASPLAAALIEAPDLLVLDEPTNHLSVEGVEWLEETLSGMSGTTTLLVSHDRAFIDATCPDILELDGVGGAHRHRGGYAAYLEGRERRWAAEAHDRAARRETRCARRRSGCGGSPRPGRRRRRRGSSGSTPVRARGDGGEQGEGGRARGVQVDEDGGRDRRVRRRVARLRRRAEGKNGGREGGERRKIIMDGFSYSFSKGEKIALVGPNGAGKTTFLRTIMGEIPLDSGWVAVGERIAFAFAPDARVPGPWI